MSKVDPDENISPSMMNHCAENLIEFLISGKLVTPLIVIEKNHIKIYTI